MTNQEQMRSLRQRLHDLLRANKLAEAAELLASHHPADQAQIIEKQEEEMRRQLLHSLSSAELAGILEYLDKRLRADLVSNLSPSVLAPVLERVDEDVAADIVQDLSPEQATEVAHMLRESVQELLGYAEQSAGGRMSANYVALKPGWTVDESIEFLRREAPDETHPFYLYVVDDDGHLTGTVSLRRLVTARPETSIGAIMQDEVRLVLVSEDQELVAERMRRYNLLALPVVDDEFRLRGVVTADDVMDVLVEEATEDIYRLAGLAEEERIFRPVKEALPPRLGWLMLNMVTALLAALVVSLFEGTIERVAVLAVFLPMVGGMAGNAGLQTLTLVVRSIALGEVEAGDGMRVLRREATIALINGLIIGSCVGFVAWMWKGNAWLGFIVGAALLANIGNAVISGVFVPFTLRRFKLDPALASGVIVTLADVVGFLFFLGLAALLVSKLS